MIYLDNAATSFPKPPSVILGMKRCMQSYCGNPGRGSHALARSSAEAIFTCRSELCDFFGLESPESVIFTSNTTSALNLAIKGLLRRGDHVLISDMEHNAVLRPLHRLRREGIVTFDVFKTNPEEENAEQILKEIACKMRPNTRMVIAAHASNICSATLPLSAIGALCRSHGILFLVDAAQSAGHLPIDMKSMQIDALAIPGHKGLLGPQGVGALLLREGLIPSPMFEGGSGFDSKSPDMPMALPERLEAGTLATPMIVGLLEGVREVRRLGLSTIQETEEALTDCLFCALKGTPHMRFYASSRRGGILLFSIDGLSSEAAADALDRRGICVRAGLHCAPLAHQTLGTPPSGAVRISPSIFNTMGQMQTVAREILEIAKE